MLTIFSTTTNARTVSLSNGPETVDVQIPRPPLLFGSILDRALPLGAEDTPQHSYRLQLRTVLWAAEGLRPAKPLPPTPAIDAGADAWQSYAEQLAELFRTAGLLPSHIRELANAALDLAMGDTDKSNMTQALAAAGNG